MQVKIGRHEYWELSRKGKRTWQLAVRLIRAAWGFIFFFPFIKIFLNNWHIFFFAHTLALRTFSLILFQSFLEPNNNKCTLYVYMGFQNNRAGKVVLINTEQFRQKKKFGILSIVILPQMSHTFTLEVPTDPHKEGCAGGNI